MSDRGQARTLLAVLTLVALVVLTIDFRDGPDGPLGTVQRGVRSAFAPVQEGFATVVRPIGAVVSAIGDVGTLREDNAQLASEVARLRAEARTHEDIARENAELRDLLSMGDRLQMQTVAAQVIGQPPGQVAFSVLIDAGADDGLQPGMAVLDERGLVGKLSEVVTGHATVELVSSPAARYAVRTAPSGQSGLLQGQGSRPFLMEVRDPAATVDDGDLVVTSSFQGSSIPDGIPVGRVAADDSVTNPRYRAVRPFVDFSGLSLVQVVTNAPTAPTELPAEDLVPAPERPRPRVTPEAAPESPEPDAQPVRGPA